MKSSKQSRDLLIAMAIGDGTVNSNGYLAIRHSVKQKEYLQWKSDLLRKVGVNTTGLYFVDNGGYGSYEMRTYTSKFLKLLRKILYKPTKTLTTKLLNRIGVIGLAIWYMDDGSLSNRYSTEGTVKSSVLTISTCCSREQNQIIIDFLRDKYNISFGQRKMGKQYALICGTREARKFIELVSPVVKQVPCMHYKLNVKQPKSSKG